MKFKIIVILFISLVYGYVQNQLLGSLELELSIRLLANLALFIPFALFSAQPLYFWSKEDQMNEGIRLLIRKFLYITISYVNYLAVLVILRDVTTLLLSLFKVHDIFQYDLNETLILVTMPVGLFLLGYLTVLLGPAVLYRKLSSEKLSEQWKNFRIVQISDLHLGAANSVRLVRRSVEKINALKPDVVVFTGDLFDGVELTMREQFEHLKKIESKNLFFCSGNHEYYWDYRKLSSLLEEMDMLWLNNSKTEIKKKGDDKIAFYGIPDPQARGFGHEGPNWNRLETLFDNNEYRILLCHQPFLFDEASERGFDLQLSGHTHNGQFFPWNFFIRFFQKYTKGFYKRKGSLLYVNQGTAHWGPPDRLGTLCEITCFDIT